MKTASEIQYKFLRNNSLVMNAVDFSVKTYKPVGVISKLEQHKIL